MSDARTHRPRKCRTCHKDATHVEETVLPTKRITIDAQLVHGSTVERVYWCDEHGTTA